ncbi:glycosyltransferase [Alkalihalobacillus sp. BA299]|uniref:glycosyltransferase n=1 Tax=Alkalihalobacillus sp. BA299 TaxID=2815938 RepID=UPI001ADC8D16|nr:glycosyltransferase [Alkalihalobacillus sp. BA299]
MKKILIASFDMEVGGVERSLISMLENFDYDNYQVDLMLYRHQGDFLNLIPDQVNLLPEIPQYATFRKSISEIMKEKQFTIGTARLLSKINTEILRRVKNIAEPGYYQMQLMWKYALPFLPQLEKEYDVAISYLWPHDFVGEKVRAKKKFAWIHTDYSTVDTDPKVDRHIWGKFDHIVSISEDCTKAFLSKYPYFGEKILLIENITSPTFVKRMAKEEINDVEFTSDYFNIVSVGRLCYQKAFDNAIKALRILHDKGYTNIKWYVVGYGGEEHKLEELIQTHKLKDSFILLGKKINPYPYMAKCDLYVQPSRYEGKAVTVTEAKILGKSIIITDYPTAKSQVSDRIDGYITDLSIEGIVDGVEEVYNNFNLRKSMANYCEKANYSNRNELKKLYGKIEGEKNQYLISETV